MMKIRIKSARHRLVFWVPICLINAHLIQWVSHDQSDPEARRQFQKMLPVIRRSLRQLKKRERHFVLVDVHAASGDIVKITL